MPYKKSEFKQFLKIITNEGQFAHWAEIGRALNIDKNTISTWKQLPEAQEALAQGIAKALQEMETAGRKDWRMWESKLKMMGINPATKLEHDVSDPISEILSKYGLNDAGKTPETESRPPQSPA